MQFNQNSSFDTIERAIITLEECAELGKIPDPNRMIIIANKLIEMANKIKKIQQNRELNL